MIVGRGHSHLLPVVKNSLKTMMNYGIMIGSTSNKRQFIWFEHEMLLKHAIGRIGIEAQRHFQSPERPIGQEIQI